MKQFLAFTAGVALFFFAQAAFALGPYKEVLPSGTLNGARRTGRLLATVHFLPCDFECDGKKVSFKEAWVQRTKNERRTVLCFTLSGFQRKHRFTGFGSDDLEFAGFGQYFGCYSGWFDGHQVHMVDITDIASSSGLSESGKVFLYGSAKNIKGGMNNASVLQTFEYEIQPHGSCLKVNSKSATER